MVDVNQWADAELDQMQKGLTVEALSTIMRSTWTWDDRALRRDLAGFLTRLGAVRNLPPGTAILPIVRGRVLDEAQAFLAAVLGARAIADSGHADSYSHSDIMIRSPWLSGSIADRHAVVAIGEQALAGASTENEYAAKPADEVSSEYSAHALAACGNDPVARDHLDQVQSGALRATFAAAEATGSWDPAIVSTRAAVIDGQWVLDGEKVYVPNAAAADLFLVIARSTAGPTLFAVKPSAEGLTVSEMQVLDNSLPLARLAMDNVEAMMVGGEGAGGRLMGKALDSSVVSLAAEQVSGAGRSLQLAVEAVRKSNGGSFALEQLGELVLRLQLAQSSLDDARNSVEGGRADVSVTATMAHIECSNAFVDIAGVAVRLVGDPSSATGLESGQLFRRALSSNLLFGGPALYYERLLENLGL